MNRRNALPALLAAVALATASAGTAVAGHAAFSDAAGTHEAGIHWLADSGVTGGCGGGRFCTEDPVKRGQMATFLHRLSGKGSIPPVVNADKVDGLDAEQLRGQQGPVGPTGPQGPAGADAKHRFAVVNSDGTLARGSAGTSVGTFSVGLYSVTFDTSVVGCAFTSTLGTAVEGTPQPGIVTNSPISSAGGGVNVRTYDLAGNSAPGPSTLSSPADRPS